jgi:histidinol phosphatase-like enzyme
MDNCDCRKPKPGMLENYILSNRLLLKKCLFIGDSKVDEACAESQGITFFQMRYKDWTSPEGNSKINKLGDILRMKSINNRP